jgi:hypothetical protein
VQEEEKRSVNNKIPVNEFMINDFISFQTI